MFYLVTGKSKCCPLSVAFLTSVKVCITYSKNDSTGMLFVEKRAVCARELSCLNVGLNVHGFGKLFFLDFLRQPLVHIRM